MDEPYILSLEPRKESCIPVEEKEDDLEKACLIRGKAPIY
jgi:hypothetical protein